MKAIDVASRYTDKTAQEYKEYTDRKIAEQKQFAIDIVAKTTGIDILAPNASDKVDKTAAHRIMIDFIWVYKTRIGLFFFVLFALVIAMIFGSNGNLAKAIYSVFSFGGGK